MVGFEKERETLEGMGVAVVAASVDPLDKAQEVANEVGFPVGFGVTREIADKLGSWWEDRRSIVQPSEFVLDADNRVVLSSYSDGPLGRVEAADVVKLVNFYESRK